jgi:3-hydroxybutyryl-CoA dehydrogenase
MKILIISKNPVATLFGKTVPFTGTDCVVMDNIPATGYADFDLLIDLSFEDNPEQIAHYKNSAQPVLLGSVIYTLKELEIGSAPIARFNHWPVFKERNCIEVAIPVQHQAFFQKLFNQLEIPFLITADEPGFVTARTVSMIINEAFLSQQEGVSTAAEIDTAMKLGTSYPYGPFEWCKLLGPDSIIQLLQKLTVSDQRYEPAASLLASNANS